MAMVWHTTGVECCRLGRQIQVRVVTVPVVIEGQAAGVERQMVNHHTSRVGE